MIDCGSDLSSKVESRHSTDLEAVTLQEQDRKHSPIALVSYLNVHGLITEELFEKHN